MNHMHKETALEELQLWIDNVDESTLSEFIEILPDLLIRYRNENIDECLSKKRTYCKDSNWKTVVLPTDLIKLKND